MSAFLGGSMRESLPRLRPRDLGELIDETLALYRRNFALFAGVVAVVAVPQAVLAALSLLFANTVVGAIAIILVFVTIAFYIVMIAALARVISRRYLAEESTVIGAYRSIGWRLVFRLLGAFIMWALCLSISVSFFLIPAIVIAVYWLFVPQVIVLEGSSVANSLDRSWKLVTGNFWRVFFYGLAVYVAYVLVQWGITEAVLFGLSPLGAGGAIVAGLISAVVSTLCLPFLFGSITLLYYDLRIRKEGFDLELLARDLSLQPPA